MAAALAALGALILGAIAFWKRREKSEATSRFERERERLERESEADLERIERDADRKRKEIEMATKIPEKRKRLQKLADMVNRKSQGKEDHEP